MAEYLLSTPAFVALVRRRPTDPVLRWAATRALDRDGLALSVVSIGQLHEAIMALPARSAARPTWQRNFDATVREIERRGGRLLDFTARCARRWAELEPLELFRRGEGDAPETLSTPDRQVVAQCLVRELTLVETEEPYHRALAAQGLALAHPEGAPAP